MEVENRLRITADQLSKDAEVFMQEEISGMEPLPKTLVERGEVFKTLVLETKECTIALLTLLPGAKIREHQHIDDKECYYYVKDKVAKICSMGDSHSLENKTNEIMFVLSIKYR